MVLIIYGLRFEEDLHKLLPKNKIETINMVNCLRKNANKADVRA